MVQLSRPQPWQSQALEANQFNHALIAFAYFVLATQTLVIRLSTYAEMAASPANAQVFDELLREDLPKGFFTTRTP